MDSKSFEGVITIVERVAVIVKEIAEVIRRNVSNADAKDEKKEV